jgi:hypothetical protein
MRVEPALLVSQLSGLAPAYVVSLLGDGRSQYMVVVALAGFPALAIATAVVFAALHQFLITHTTGAVAGYLLAGLFVGGTGAAIVTLGGGGLLSGAVILVWLIWVFVIARLLVGAARIKVTRT